MVTLTRRAFGAAALGSALAAGLPRVGQASGLVTVPEPIDAPPLALPGLDGSAHDLAAYRGRPVLVSFWAVWCAPCRVEMPALARLRKTMATAGGEVLAVDLGDSEARIHAFLERVDAPGLPILLDRQQVTAAPWHIAGLPAAYAIDRGGRIRLAALGAQAWDQPDIAHRLLALG